MHALLVKAVPTVALRSLAITLAILRSVVVQHVMLARHIKNLVRAQALQPLIERVKLRRLRKMAQVARVQYKRRRRLKRIHLGNRRIQRRRHVRIGSLVKPNMAVADLHKAQIRLRRSQRPIRHVAKRKRFQHASLNHAQRPSPGPSHALQKPAPVHSVLIEIVSLIKVVPLRFQNIIDEISHRSPLPSPGRQNFQRLGSCPLV